MDVAIYYEYSLRKHVLSLHGFLQVETWICPNCEVGQHQCFACGKLGKSTESADEQEVILNDWVVRDVSHGSDLFCLVFMVSLNNSLDPKLTLYLQPPPACRFLYVIITDVGDSTILLVWQNSLFLKQHRTIWLVASN